MDDQRQWQTYRLFNSSTSPPQGISAYSIQMRWVNRAFHTPNSNSCSRSTTSILPTLRFWPRRCVKAFYSWDSKRKHNQKRQIRCITVGTEEVGLSSRATAVPLIGLANWYMNWRTVCTTSYSMLRAWLIRCARSRTWPMRSMFSFGIKQRGQGQSPLSRIVARRTLLYHRVSTKIPVTQRLNVLLWIISRVRENAWVHALLHLEVTSTVQCTTPKTKDE